MKQSFETIQYCIMVSSFYLDFTRDHFTNTNKTLRLTVLLVWEIRSLHHMKGDSSSMRKCGKIGILSLVSREVPHRIFPSESF